MSGRELHLNVNALHAGFVPSAWRTPKGNPRASFEVRHFVEVAKVAERGTFDAIFFADGPAITEQIGYRTFSALEPTIILATIAAHTDYLGLIATASTSFNDPYNIARRFGSLDLASGGRAGWNVVTTADLASARNFGLSQVTAHRTRYERAAEFTAVVKALWDSWEDDAFIGDKEAARLVDPAKVHAIAHHGRFFAVHGPLTTPRSPQGRPVVVQAGGSDDGRDLAAQHAEAVFSLSQSFEEAIDYAKDLRRRAAAYGRGPDSIVVLPGLATVIGSTEEEARRRNDELIDLIPLDYSLSRLAGTLGIPRDRLELDRPLPDDLAVPPNGNHTMFHGTVALARSGHLTVRQLIKALGGGTGHRVFVGTPEQLADDIEAWFRAGAADGFNLMPDVLPEGLETFVDEVVPLLRRKGIFRSEYRGRTLRDHFGLPRPAGRGAAPIRASA